MDFHPIILTLIMVYGLLIGSFLNVCIYRIPLRKSIVRPRSGCPHCSHQLSAWENIPVISYLFLRGKCSNCSDKISLRYPLVEILTAIIFGLVYVRFGLSLDFIAFVLFLSVVIAITFIDLDHQIIPNGMLLIGIIPGTYPMIRDGLGQSVQYVIGAVSLGAGFYLIGLLGKLVFKQDSLGMGDVKYAALIGLILGWQGGLIAVALAFFSAAILFLLLMVFGKLSFGERAPFGPFISFGAFLSIFWGQIILHWYLSLFV